MSIKSDISKSFLAVEVSDTEEDSGVVNKSEKELERFLFGTVDISGDIDSTNDIKTEHFIESSEGSLQNLDDESLFVMDSGKNTENFNDENRDISTQQMRETKKLSKGLNLQSVLFDAPAWIDDDDESGAGKRSSIDLTAKSFSKKLRKHEDETEISLVEYEKRLRSHHEKTFGKPLWAEKPDKDQGRQDSIFQSTKFLSKDTDSKYISSDSINISRVRDANWREYQNSVVQSIDWHPNGEVLLSAGLDKYLRLFHIDGKSNQKLQSVYFKSMPIFQAGFNTQGSEIILAGRRKFFYSYDVESSKITKIPGIQGRQEKSFEKFKISPCGKYISFLGNHGDIILLSSSTKMPVGVMSMNGSVRDIEFSIDGQYLYSTGTDSEVYQWDLRMGNRCVHKFTDESAFKPTSLGISLNSRFIGSGDESGMVNIYDTCDCLSQATPKPFKSIGSLTTYVDNLCFNPDSQIMAISSRVKKDQFRLVHLPSGKVFNNWPTAGTPLGYVQDMKFSPESRYLAIGNDKGKVLLYRLQHYA